MRSSAWRDGSEQLHDAGQIHRHFTATYGPTSYRIEFNGRGNAVDGRTGDALSADEMDQRMLSTGRWLWSSR